jgi:hypothetical protein
MSDVLYAIQVQAMITDALVTFQTATIVAVQAAISQASTTLPLISNLVAAIAASIQATIATAFKTMQTSVALLAIKAMQAEVAQAPALAPLLPIVIAPKPGTFNVAQWNYRTNTGSKAYVDATLPVVTIHHGTTESDRADSTDGAVSTMKDALTAGS